MVDDPSKSILKIAIAQSKSVDPGMNNLERTIRLFSACVLATEIFLLASLPKEWSLRIYEQRKKKNKKNKRIVSANSLLYESLVW